MKTKILSILALLLTVTQGAWAQTTADVGRVIAADGKMYKTVTLANKVSTASGVVAYVGAGGSVYSGRSDLKAIAISLTDAPGGSMKWGPTGEPVQYYTMSTDYSTLLSQTDGAYTTQYAVEHTCSGHPALQAAWNYSTQKPSGASTWFMPCIGQWNLIVKALTGSGSNLSNAANSALAYDKVSAKLTAAGASSLSNNHYWLSNEYSNDEAWEYMQAGYLDKVGKGFSWAVRPIFCFASASNAYVVEYNANGGSGAPTAQSKTHGTALTLSSTVPTRDGYTFAGWATSAEGPVAYSAGGSYTTDNDIVLYAKWTPTYTATFAAGNDNTGWDIDPASGVEGATVTVSYKGENKVKSVTVQAKP